MQGARRANIPTIFNRRATPQDGMHRFPNADVFVGRDTRLEVGRAVDENEGPMLSSC
jgi:hypothetical protein